jgi:hypothetical protein
LNRDDRREPIAEGCGRLRRQLPALNLRMQKHECASPPMPILFQQSGISSGMDGVPTIADGVGLTALWLLDAAPLTI